MQTIAWRQDGELTHTVPWFGSNESALRATIADLMQSPGVRSVSFQEPRNQLLIRYDAAVTDAQTIRAGTLGCGTKAHDVLAGETVRWAPTASKVLLKLATALIR